MDSNNSRSTNPIVFSPDIEIKDEESNRPYRVNSVSTLQFENQLFAELKEHYDNKEQYMQDESKSKRLEVLTLLGCFVFILVRELPYHLDNRPIDQMLVLSLPYFKLLEFDLIYYVPNMFLPLIIGFLSDSASNQRIGVRFLLFVMLANMILAQLPILITQNKTHNYAAKIVSRFLFSFCSESFIALLISFLAIWFKNRKQIQRICRFVALEDFAFTTSYLISALVYWTQAPEKDNSNNNTAGSQNHDNDDSNNFNYCTLAMLIILFMYTILCCFLFPKSYEQEQNSLGVKLRLHLSHIKIFKSSELSKDTRIRFESTSSVARFRTKKSLMAYIQEDVIPTSFLAVLSGKVFTLQSFRLGAIHGIISVGYFFFMNIVIHFIFAEQTGTTIDFFEKSTIAKVAINFLKGLITFFWVPRFLDRSGNRYMLLFLAIIVFIFAYVLCALTLQETTSPCEFHQILYGILNSIVLFGVCVGSTLQNATTYSYIPVMVAEEFYVTMYGFFASIRSTFIIVFVCIFYGFFGNSPSFKNENLTKILGVIFLMLIVALILLILLEIKDQKNRRQFYEKEAKKNEFLERGMKLPFVH